MVRKLFKALSKEVNGLHEAAYLLAVFAIFSQILALVRDRLLTYFFGASTDLDVYYAAFKIPDIIYVLVASTVSISVLVPFLSEKIGKSGENSREYINSLFTFFIFSIVFISLIAFILMPYIIPILFSGIPGEKMNMLIWLSRLLLLQPILLGIANFLGSVIQIYKQFGIYAFGSVLYNSGIILGIIFLYPAIGIFGIGIGVLVGVILHILIQIPLVYKKGFLPRIISRLNFISIKDTVLLALPRTFTLGVQSFAILLISALASRITEGSISIFTLASNLEGVPLAIIGLSYSLAAFPQLSDFYNRNRIDLFISEISMALRHIIFWSLPIITLFVVLRAQIVRVILGASTKFTWDDTRLTTAVLATLSIGVLAQGITLLLTRGFYAGKETKIPLIINTVGASLMFLISYGLIKAFYAMPSLKDFFASIFRINNVVGGQIIALGLGVSISMTISAIVLWIMFEKKFKGVTRTCVKTLRDSLISSLVLGFFAYIFLGVFDNVFSLRTTMGVFLQGLFAGIIAIIAHILMLRLLNNSELRDVGNIIHKKFWKTRAPIVETNNNSSF